MTFSVTMAPTVTMTPSVVMTFSVTMAPLATLAPVLVMHVCEEVFGSVCTICRQSPHSWWVVRGREATQLVGGEREGGRGRGRERERERERERKRKGEGEEGREGGREEGREGGREGESTVYVKPRQCG